jgi:hypothetical protein
MIIQTRRVLDLTQKITEQARDLRNKCGFLKLKIVLPLDTQRLQAKGSRKNI